MSVVFFQDIWTCQSSIGVATGENRLQVHFQQEVYRGRLSDMAPAQPGTAFNQIRIEFGFFYTLYKMF